MEAREMERQVGIGQVEPGSPGRALRSEIKREWGDNYVIKFVLFLSR